MLLPRFAACAQLCRALRDLRPLQPPAAIRVDGLKEIADLRMLAFARAVCYSALHLAHRLVQLRVRVSGQSHGFCHSAQPESAAVSENHAGVFCKTDTYLSQQAAIRLSRRCHGHPPGSTTAGSTAPGPADEAETPRRPWSASVALCPAESRPVHPCHLPQHPPLSASRAGERMPRRGISSAGCPHGPDVGHGFGPLPSSRTFSRLRLWRGPLNQRRWRHRPAGSARG